MEDVKWLIKKYGFFIVLMVIIVITGSIILGKRGSEKNAEEVWEPPVIIESRETVKEDESMECFAEESEEPATISPMEVYEDGTITLYVDGVWPDYNSDYAFTNQIVVQPFQDGTFRYLSNTIEQKELELPRIEK